MFDDLLFLFKRFLFDETSLWNMYRHLDRMDSSLRRVIFNGSCSSWFMAFGLLSLSWWCASCDRWSYFHVVVGVVDGLGIGVKTYLVWVKENLEKILIKLHPRRPQTVFPHPCGYTSSWCWQFWIRFNGEQHELQATRFHVLLLSGGIYAGVTPERRRRHEGRKEQR